MLVLQRLRIKNIFLYLIVACILDILHIAFSVFLKRVTEMVECLRIQVETDRAGFWITGEGIIMSMKIQLRFEDITIQ